MTPLPHLKPIAGALILVGLLVTCSQVFAVPCICGRAVAEMHTGPIVATAAPIRVVTHCGGAACGIAPCPVPAPPQCPPRKLRRGYGEICPAHGCRVYGCPLPPVDCPVSCGPMYAVRSSGYYNNGYVPDQSAVTTTAPCPCPCTNCNPTHTPLGTAIR